LKRREGRKKRAGRPVQDGKARFDRRGVFGLSSNSALFESAVVGANPAPAANFRPVVIAIREANGSFRAPYVQGLGSPIASRLAYTQKSNGLNLPGRSAFALRRDKPAPIGHRLAAA